MSSQLGLIKLSNVSVCENTETSTTSSTVATYTTAATAASVTTAAKQAESCGSVFKCSKEKITELSNKVKNGEQKVLAKLATSPPGLALDFLLDAGERGLIAAGNLPVIRPIKNGIKNGGEKVLIAIDTGARQIERIPGVKRVEKTAVALGPTSFFIPVLGEIQTGVAFRGLARYVAKHQDEKTKNSIGFPIFPTTQSQTMNTPNPTTVYEQQVKKPTILSGKQEENP